MYRIQAFLPVLLPTAFMRHGTYEDQLLNRFLFRSVQYLVPSVGFCLLYIVSQCSFHLLIISLSSKALPCRSLTPNIYCGNLPHSSSIVLKIFRELWCLDPRSTSEHLSATHWSLDCLAFLSISLVWILLACLYMQRAFAVSHCCSYNITLQHAMVRSNRACISKNFINN